MRTRWDKSRIAGAFAALCSVLVLLAIAVPVALQGNPAPEAPIANGISATKLEPADSASGDPAGQAEDEGDVLPASADESDEQLERLEYAPSTVLARIADGVSLDELNARLAELDYVATGGLSADDVHFGYVKLDLTEGVEVEEALAKLEGEGFASSAEPDYIMYLLDESEAMPEAAADAARVAAAGDAEAEATSPSPSGSLVSALSSDIVALTTSINDLYSKSAASSATHWMLDAINAYDAWDVTNARGNHKVTVAVLDSGVNVNHADLKYNITGAWSVLNNSSNVVDSLGHGTHVAGIIAAEANNEIGVAGVSYNAYIMPVQVIQANGDVFESDAIAGIDYVIKHKNDNANAPVRVVNMSFGGWVSGNVTANPRYSASGTTAAAFLAAINELQKNDILVVCAAGNYANTDTHKKGGSAIADTAYKCFPCDFDSEAIGVINLARSGSSYKRAAGSNFNMAGQTTKELSAPGESIYSTVSNGYDYKSGTSMATPCVSGVAAMLFAVDPSLSASAVKSTLISTATDLGPAGFDLETGYGMVNAYRAVSEASAYISGGTTVQVGKQIAFTTGGFGAWSWSSSNSAVATVANGVVTGVSRGTARITAATVLPLFGTVTRYQDVTVYDPVISGDSSVAVGSSIALSIPSSPEGYWSWTSSDASVATVGSSGTTVSVKGPKAGKAKIRVALSTNADIYSEKEITVTKGNLSNAGISLSPASFKYTGGAQTPNPVVTLGGKTLVKNTDYTLSYRNNTAVGMATVVATGMGSYEGTKSATFAITAAELASVSLSQTSFTYDGTAKKPSVIVYGPKNGKTGQVLSAATDYTVSYRNNTAVGTATVTVTGKGNYTGTIAKSFSVVEAAASVTYRTHVQNVGWQGYVSNGTTSGTSGRSLRLEGINIALSDPKYSGGITYRTHVQNVGWQTWRSNGEMSGTSGQSLRLEAIQIKLTGEMANHYDVYYRVHCQNIGWMGWAKNGESAGSEGYGYRLEAIQVKLVAKGMSAPSASPANAVSQAFAPLVKYRTHVQNVGWQGYVRDGEMSGTSGQSLRLEGINIALGTTGISGGITYRTHVQNIGWQAWMSNGAMSGTSGRSLRLEAIEIKLTGAIANSYDVYYRVHCQNFGWMGWAKNGESAGSEGYAYRLEGIQVKLVPQGGAAPGSTATPFRRR